MIAAMNLRRPASAAALAAVLTGAGILHFAVPARYDAIVPEQLPGAARTWTRGGGAAVWSRGAGAAVRSRGAGAPAPAAVRGLL